LYIGGLYIELYKYSHNGYANMWSQSVIFHAQIAHTQTAYI